VSESDRKIFCGQLPATTSLQILNTGAKNCARHGRGSQLMDRGVPILGNRNILGSTTMYATTGDVEPMTLGWAPLERYGISLANNK
jgi:hypothetical protein